jgi:hypothetical protein
MQAMTKEEFNKKWPMSGIPDSIRAVAVAWGDAYGWFIEDKVKLAQDILEATDKHVSKISEQQAIAFAEWITDNGWVHYPSRPGQWADLNTEGRVAPTKELYTLFLSQQK